MANGSGKEVGRRRSSLSGPTSSVSPWPFGRCGEDGKIKLMTHGGTGGGARLLFLWPHKGCVECFLPTSPIQICMHMAGFKRLLAGAILIMHFKLGISGCPVLHARTQMVSWWMSVDMPNYRLTRPHTAEGGEGRRRPVK
jgi:hypothetical protein